MKYVFLLTAIVLEVIATNSLKAADGFSRLWPSLVTVCGYAGAFYFLGLTLRHMSLGVAYAVWAGLGIVLTVIGAFFLFKEKPDLPAALGMGLIVAGVVVINLFSKTAGH